MNCSSFEIIPSINFCQPILSCEVMNGQYTEFTVCPMCIKVMQPWCWTYLMRRKVAWGNFCTEVNHPKILTAYHGRVRTWPFSVQWSLSPVVSTVVWQLGHSCPRCLCLVSCEMLERAVKNPKNCLHMNIWCILSSECSLFCTGHHATSSNAGQCKMCFDWKSQGASLEWIWNYIRASVSVSNVILE